jgi:HAD superfamily hydrolase (TIGR01509 family)
MKPKAIIFDVDGTLANTERWGHLPACNDALKEIGLPFQWEWEYFKQLALISGTDARLRLELEKRDFPEDVIDDYVTRFGPIKKKYYLTKYVTQVNLRSGITAFIQKAIQQDIRLATVSVSYEAQIHALLDASLSEEKVYFSPILGKESGIKNGAEGMLYEKCLDILGLAPEECLAIEDSPCGLQSALKAGIPTWVFYNEFTEGQDFSGAAVVESSITKLNMEKIFNQIV